MKDQKNLLKVLIPIFGVLMLILGFNALCGHSHQITGNDISFNTHDMPSELREVTDSKLILNYSFQWNSLNNTTLSFEVEVF